MLKAYHLQIPAPRYLDSCLILNQTSKVAIPQWFFGNINTFWHINIIKPLLNSFESRTIVQIFRDEDDEISYDSNFVVSLSLVHTETPVTAYSPTSINIMDGILYGGTSLVNSGIFQMSFTSEEISVIHFFWDRETNLIIHILNLNPNHIWNSKVLPLLLIVLNLLFPSYLCISCC